MADIFISYKSVRRRATLHLARILEAHGFSVWFDYNLLPGSDFGRQIKTHLSDARVVIVLWCPMAEGSDWVMSEAREAQRLSKYVPVKLLQCDLPLGLDGIQTMNFTDWTGDPEWPEVARIVNHVGRMLDRDPAPNLALLDSLAAAWRSSNQTFPAEDRKAVQDIALAATPASPAAAPDASPGVAEPAARKGLVERILKTKSEEVSDLPRLKAMPTRNRVNVGFAILGVIFATLTGVIASMTSAGEVMTNWEPAAYSAAPSTEAVPLPAPAREAQETGVAATTTVSPSPPTEAAWAVAPARIQILGFRFPPAVIVVALAAALFATVFFASLSLRRSY